MTKTQIFDVYHCIMSLAQEASKYRYLNELNVIEDWTTLNVLRKTFYNKRNINMTMEAQPIGRF